jgi:hypothetical protein
MAKKPVGVPRSGEGDRTPTDADPAVALLHALVGVHGACTNATAFRRLAERRARARNIKLEYLPARAAIIAKRADAKAKGRATFKQVSAELAGIERAATTRPTPEPAGMLKPLHAVLANGRDWIARAREAVRKGGADVLADDPTANPRKLLARLSRGDELFALLGADLADPSAIIDARVGELDELGTWADELVAELSAAIELGARRMPTPATDDDASGFYPAGAFPGKMAARLRMAARKARKTKRVATRSGPNGERLYSLSDAKRWWPRDLASWSPPA